MIGSSFTNYFKKNVYIKLIDYKYLHFSGLKEGSYTVILTTPEALEAWKDVICSQVYKERICLIAIDEAHIVPAW